MTNRCLECGAHQRFPGGESVKDTELCFGCYNRALEEMIEAAQSHVRAVIAEAKDHLPHVSDENLEILSRWERTHA